MANRGVNKVILIGSVGQDPEVRYASNGNAITNISIATNESWKDKQSGELREKTEWHRVVFFGRLAEIVGEYVRKGSKLYVEGKLQTRKWQDQNGQDRYTTEVVVDIGGQMQMLDSKGGSVPYNDGQQNKTPASAPQPAAASSAPQTPPEAEGTFAVDDFDDDIPF